METKQHIKLSTLIDQTILGAIENDLYKFQNNLESVLEFYDFDTSSQLSKIDIEELRKSFLRDLPLNCNSRYFIESFRSLLFDTAIRFDSYLIVEILLPFFVLDKTFPDERFKLAIENGSKKSLIKLIETLDFPAIYFKGERVNSIPLIISLKKYSLAREIANYFQIRCDYLDASCHKTENYSAITYIIENSKSEIDILKGIIIAIELDADITGIANSIHPSPIESAADISFICFNYLYALFQLGKYSKPEYDPTDLLCIALNSKNHDLNTKSRFIDLLEGEDINQMVVLRNIIEMNIDQVPSILIYFVDRGFVGEDQIFQLLIELGRKDIIKLIQEYGYFSKYRIR